ncbi:MAG: RNase adapter RapZ [bacterium]|nr:MAG: RNase adapter RapZ [bacterium]
MTSSQLLIISGYSGSGKTTVLRTLEDMGYYTVDNLPIDLLPSFVHLASTSGSTISRAAMVMDIRGGESVSSYPEVIRSLKESGYSIKVIFLEASLEALQKRFSETRRVHPLDHSLPLLEALSRERQLLEPLKESADIHLDTSDLGYHDLRKFVADRFRTSGTRERMLLTFLSFGFKNGLPKEADMVLDVRFLTNPFFVEELRDLDGRTPEVSSFVYNADGAGEFLGQLESFLEFLLPRYLREGRGYLTVAIGCTGGRHRSVAIVERMSQYFRDRDHLWVQVRHRDLPEV